MNAKQELLAKYEAWIDQGKQLKEQIDALPDDKPVPVGRWKPENGGKYYFITSDAHIMAENGGISNLRLSGRYALANTYRTEGEAQAALDQQLATVRVLDRIAELNAEQGWTYRVSSQNNYYMICDNGRFSLDWSREIKCLPTTHYGSKQTIETVIEEMESDCLLMLGVSGIEK